MGVVITITIDEETSGAAWAQLQMVANSVMNNQTSVDSLTKVSKSESSTDTQDNAKVESREAPAESPKKAAGRRKATAAPEAEAAKDDTPAPPDTKTEPKPDAAERDAIVTAITQAYREGDDAMKAKIVEWRNSVGVKLLRDLTAEHVPAGRKFLKDLSQ